MLPRPTLHTVRELMKCTVGDAIGTAAVAIGLPPPAVCSPRLAVETWARALEKIPEPDKGPILFLAIRNTRWMEWAVFSACCVAKLGYRPIVTYSGAEAQLAYRTAPFFSEHIGRGFWTATPRLRHVRFIDIDHYLRNSEPGASEFLSVADESAASVAAYDLKVEEYEDDADGRYLTAWRTARGELARYAAAVYALLGEVRPGRVVCPSGLIGMSPAVREAAARRGVTAIFVEGWAIRPGHVIWNFNRPALSYDIEGWAKTVGRWDENKERVLQDFLRFREGHPSHSNWLRDFHQVQRAGRDAAFPAELDRFLKRPGPTFLLGTNVVGDSATLRRHSFFRNQKEWLERIIAFFQSHPELKLIIRAHPDEVWQKAPVRLGEFAAARAAGAENITVVGGSQAVNTFALVERCDVGLAWVSNFGLDMALRGKPVLLAARAQYADLGICATANSREEYFERLVELAASPAPPRAEAIQAGKLYQYIVFNAMSLRAEIPSYHTTGWRLDEQPQREEERLKFYRILVGELNEKGTPWTTQ